MVTTITKTDWLAAQECLGLAWRAARADREIPDDAARFRMEQGQEVGRRARHLFSGGVVASEILEKGTTALTPDAHSLDGLGTVFEAPVFACPFAARADVLVRLDNGWHVLEAKSSFAGSSRTEYVDDLAYTVMVFQRAGFAVRKASLLLLTREYRFGDPDERLFAIQDETTTVLTRAAEFASLADAHAGVILGDAQPSPHLSPACRTCPWFESECLGHGADHTVLELPRLSASKIAELADLGVVALSDLPRDYKLTPPQERVRHATASGSRQVAPDLAHALERVRWPCHYLDFETVATVLPLYLGHRCHQQVPTQFSLHRRSAADSPLQHFDYLADPFRDCQRELAEGLIAALDAEGSVLVYSSFEKQRISSLAEQFPDLARSLTAIADRLVDLCKIITDFVYDPEFRGSFSIKVVLPVLVPELSYDGLAIRDGDTAVSRFAKMALGQIIGAEAEMTRRHLLDYCQLDTLAMVRLHDRLLELARGQSD